MMRKKEFKKIPMVMDVDTGTDDAIALICALMSRDILDIKAVTAVAGNVPLQYTTKNTRNIVDTLGNTDIKVAIGADKPLKRELKCAISHGKTGLGDVILPESVRPYYEKDAADTIYEEACQNEGELVVVATGPQTNMAIAIQRYPDIVKKIKKVYIMGGCLVGGNMTQASEFNAYVDPEALQILFRSGIDVTMVGLDVTLKTELPLWVKDKVANVNTMVAKVAHDVMDCMIRGNKEMGWDVANLHDVVAVCALLNPEVITFKRYYVDVETEGTITRGMTVADFRDVCPNMEKNVNCAMDIDLEGFWKWFVELFENYKEGSMNNGK